MDEDPETIVRNIGYFVSMKKYRKGITSLSTQERIFFVVFDFDMELFNGGAAQYLVNSSGDNANDIFFSLKTIGAIKSSEVVRQLISFFPNQQIPRDRGERLQFLRLYWDNLVYRKMIEDITAKYCKDEEGIFTLLFGFYQQNIQGFESRNYDVPLNLFECGLD